MAVLIMTFFLTYLPSALRGRTERTSEMPVPQKILPTLTVRRKQTHTLHWGEHLTQGLLSGQPSGIWLPWALQWKRETEREIRNGTIPGILVTRHQGFLGFDSEFFWETSKRLFHKTSCKGCGHDLDIRISFLFPPAILSPSRK